ncbi:MAG: tetratricopeptide repeat protein [Arenicellales bacterium]
MKRYLILFSVLWAVSTGVWSDETENDADANAVQLLINDQEYENAIARVDVALRNQKNNERLLLQRGFILVQLNRLEEARKHYKKLKRKLKSNPEPANNLAMIYRLQGQYDDAIELFRETIEKFPDYSQAYENLGDTYIELAQIEYQRGADQIALNDVLASKASISSNFNQIARDNTPAGKRRSLANQLGSAEIRTVNASEESSEQQPLTTPLEAASEQVIETLRSWVTTWSNRDVDNFLAHYSREFIPAGGVGLPEWIGRKTEGISSTDFIKVRLNDIRISQNAADLVIANFVQEYETDSVNNRSLKSLT